MQESLLKVLSFIIGADGLKEETGVRQKMILSDTNVYQPDNSMVVFIVRPEIAAMEQIVFQ